MSTEPIQAPPFNTNLDTSFLSSDASSLPFWDRLSTWASENKTVVYTIAGFAVVVSGAGVAYYLSDSRKNSNGAVTEDKKRLSKKERRKAKQEKDKEKDKDKEKSAPEAEAAREEHCKLKYDDSASEGTDFLQAQAKPATVESDPLEDIPYVDESNVDTLSEQVKCIFS